MKTLIYNKQGVREHGRTASTDVAFTNNFITRNLHALDTALKATRASLRRGKHVAIRTHAQFRKAIATKQ